jgi:hypothetical protein
MTGELALRHAAMRARTLHPRAGFASVPGMEHGRAAREIQLRIWANWTPARRLQMAGALTAFAVAQRDRTLRQAHPDASDDEMRQLRIVETLRASPTLTLP